MKSYASIINKAIISTVMEDKVSTIYCRLLNTFAKSAIFVYIINSILIFLFIYKIVIRLISNFIRLYCSCLVRFDNVQRNSLKIKSCN